MSTISAKAFVQSVTNSESPSMAKIASVIDYSRK